MKDESKVHETCSFKYILQLFKTDVHCYPLSEKLTNEAHATTKHKESIQSTDFHIFLSFLSGEIN